MLAQQYLIFQSSKMISSITGFVIQRNDVTFHKLAFSAYAIVKSAKITRFQVYLICIQSFS